MPANCGVMHAPKGPGNVEVLIISCCSHCLRMSAIGGNRTLRLIRERLVSPAKRGDFAMVRSIWIVVAVLATAACGGSQTSSDNSNALRAADAALQEAVANRDLERVASFYSDDAVLMPTAEPIVTGRDAIRAEWRHVFGIPGMQNVSALKQVDVSQSDDMGYSRGTYTSRMVGADGTPVTEPGKWVSIWRKQSDGKWRIVVDTFNTDIMPPLHKPSTADAH